MEVVTLRCRPRMLAAEYAETLNCISPVENMNCCRVWHDARIARQSFGAVRGNPKRRKLKERIREHGGQLIRIAGERALRKAPVMDPPPGMGTFFCTLPYAKPMISLARSRTCWNGSDRRQIRWTGLICARGFGKTEVQCARPLLLACGQQCHCLRHNPVHAMHYKSVARTLSCFPLEVRSCPALSRKERTPSGGWQSPVARGCGRWHSWLSLRKASSFKNLGLLIIDEEQHFGVSHKSA